MFGAMTGLGLFVYFLVWLTQKLSELPSPPPPEALPSPAPDRHLPPKAVIQG